MALSNLDFEEFLRQLAAQRGTTRKLRLAARYWRQLKGLSASERERVALTLGSQVAWKQLERLFLRDGTLSEDERAVQEALDRLGDADPTELRRWAAQLRQADRRRVSDLVATAVQAALEQEAEEVGAAAFASGSEGIEGAAPDSISAEPAPAPPDATPRAAAQGATATMPTSTAPAAAGSAAATGAAPTRPEAPSPAPLASGGSSVAEDPPPVTAATRTGPTATAGPAPPTRAPDLPGPLVGDFRPEGPRRPLSAVQRLRELRELRRNPAGVAALGVSGRADLVARLGPGWASRRAVSELIRVGAVTGVDESLRLIAQLGTPTRRSWCLGVLIDHMKLSATERERVLDAAPTAAARRRLARRLDSSRTR